MVCGPQAEALRLILIGRIHLADEAGALAPGLAVALQATARNPQTTLAEPRSSLTAWAKILPAVHIG